MSLNDENRLASATLLLTIIKNNDNGNLNEVYLDSLYLVDILF